MIRVEATTNIRVLIFVSGFCTAMRLYLPARTERIQRICSGGCHSLVLFDPDSAKYKAVNMVLKQLSYQKNSFSYEKNIFS